MYISYDAFILSALISSVIGFCMNLYRLKTSTTEKGIILILLLITLVYLIWNTYCYYFVRSEKIKTEQTTARLISGLVQKKWTRPTTTTIISSTKNNPLQLNQNQNQNQYQFFYNPEKYEYRENLVELLGNVMQVLENMFPEKKDKFIVAQRGFDAPVRVQKKEYRPTFIQNDMISGYFVDGGLLYNSGIMFPPNFKHAEIGEYQFFCLGNSNHTPALEFLKNDFKLKKQIAQDKNKIEEKEDENVLYFIKNKNKQTIENKNKKKIKILKLAIEDLLQEKKEKKEKEKEKKEKKEKEEEKEIVHLMYMYGHPAADITNLDNLLFSIMNKKNIKTYRNLPISPHLKINLEYFPQFPKFQEIENKISKNDSVLLYSEKLYRLDSAFDDLEIFQSMKDHVLKKIKLKNVDQNKEGIQYDKKSLVDLFNSFSGDLILVTSPYCPILTSLFPAVYTKIYTFF